MNYFDLQSWKIYFIGLGIFFLFVTAIFLFCGLTSLASANTITSIYQAPYQPVSFTLNASQQAIHPIAGQNAYVAEGEPVSIGFSHPNGTCWYFAQGGEDLAEDYYDIPSIPDGNGSVCIFNASMSANNPLGIYTVFYSFPSSLNGKLFKDVSWNNGSLVSIFGNNAPLNEAGKNPMMVMQDLENLIQKDDIDGIETATIVLQKPELTITRLEQTGLNTITLSGTSNLANGDSVAVVVDNGNFNQQPDAANFSYVIPVNRPYANSDGIFSIDMQLPLQWMPDGWHVVTASSDGITSTARFPIYETWKPVPPPTQYINYFSNGSIKPDVVVVTQTIIVNQTIEEWHTATPTPSITDVLGETIDYPYSGNGSLPEGIALVCALGIAVIILKRDYKRK